MLHKLQIAASLFLSTKKRRIKMINEILQWIAIIILAAPKVVQVVRDFKEEEEV